MYIWCFPPEIVHLWVGSPSYPQTKCELFSNGVNRSFPSKMVCGQSRNTCDLVPKYCPVSKIVFMSWFRASMDAYPNTLTSSGQTTLLSEAAVTIQVNHSAFLIMTGRRGETRRSCRRRFVLWQCLLWQREGMSKIRCAESVKSLMWSIARHFQTLRTTPEPAKYVVLLRPWSFVPSSAIGVYIYVDLVYTRINCTSEDRD